MEDWKNRIVEEYRQTKERYEKLKAYNNKCEIEDRISDCCVSTDMKEARRKDVDTMLRHDQQKAMGDYLHWLELRAELHGIEL